MDLLVGPVAVERRTTEATRTGARGSRSRNRALDPKNRPVLRISGQSVPTRVPPSSRHHAAAQYRRTEGLSRITSTPCCLRDDRPTTVDDLDGDEQVAAALPGPHVVHMCNVKDLPIVANRA
jgi:hypothetical protein